MGCNAFAAPPRATLNIADRAYFQQAIAATGPVIGEAVVSRISKKLSLPLAQSFRDNSGKVEGVLAVLLDLDWVNEEFAHTGLPPDARLGLIDSSGTVLARYPDPDHLIGKNLKDSPFFKALMMQHGTGTTEATGFDGVSRVFAFTQFTETSSGPVYLWVGMTQASITEQAERQFHGHRIDDVVAGGGKLCRGVVWRRADDDSSYRGNRRSCAPT